MNRPFRYGNVFVLTVLLLMGMLICVAAEDDVDTTPVRSEVIVKFFPLFTRSDAPVAQFVTRPITRNPHSPILIFEPTPSIDYKILVWEPPPRDYRIIDAAPRDDNTRDDGTRIQSPPRFRFRDLVPDLPDKPAPYRPRLREYRR